MPNAWTVYLSLRERAGYCVSLLWIRQTDRGCLSDVHIRDSSRVVPASRGFSRLLRRAGFTGRYSAPGRGAPLWDAGVYHPILHL